MTLKLLASSSGPTTSSGFPEAAGQGEPTFQEMLSFVLSRGLSVRLNIQALNITLHIHNGKLEAASGYVPLSEVLVQQQAIGADEVPAPLKSEQSVGQWLLQRRSITGRQLRSALRQQARETLSFLLGQPELRYELREGQPLPVPNASLDGQEVLTEVLSRQPLSMNTVYQLADIDRAVTLEPVCWRLLRWINGRRTLGRVIQAARLSLEEGQEAARTLLRGGLIEQTTLLGLRLIVPRRLPLDSTKTPPSGIRANLFLKHVDGQRSIWEIQERLACTSEELMSVAATLYRERLIEIMQGQQEFSLLLDEY